MIRLKSFNISRSGFLRKRKLEAVVKAVLKSFGINDGELSITFATDKEIKSLNRRYRKRNMPTDVLSFAMQEGRRIAKDSAALGDVVISVERAAAQAKVFSTSFREEVELYIIHGILHLLGYDDERPAAEKEMRRKEKELMPLWQGQSS